MARTPKVSSERKADGDERSLQETERIREATLKRLLNTPPKRHAEMIKERKANRGVSQKDKRTK